jgi:hypothetical protein
LTTCSDVQYLQEMQELLFLGEAEALRQLRRAAAQFMAAHRCAVCGGGGILCRTAGAVLKLQFTLGAVES